MSDEYGGNFITLTDEDGHEIELEHLDTIEFNGSVYMAFFPAVEEEKEVEDIDLDEEYGLIILKVVEENSSPPWTARKNWRPSISSSWRNCLRTRTNKGVQTQITPARCVMVSF
mgnify:CR=1 FL=1